MTFYKYIKFQLNSKFTIFVSLDFYVDIHCERRTLFEKFVEVRIEMAWLQTVMFYFTLVPRGSNLIINFGL